MKLRQWGVYETRAGLVLLVQSELVDALAVRWAAPVVPSTKTLEVPRRLAPVVSEQGGRLHAIVPAMTAFPAAQIGRHRFDASDHSEAVIRAIDMMLSGV